MQLDREQHIDPVLLEQADADASETITYPSKANLLAETSNVDEQNRFCKLLLTEAAACTKAGQHEDAGVLLSQAAKYGHKRA